MSISIACPSVLTPGALPIKFNSFENQTNIPLSSKTIKNTTDSFDSQKVEINPVLTQNSEWSLSGNWKHFWANMSIGKYQIEDNKGINKKNATKEDIALATYAEAVSDKMKTLGQCYTGAKHALTNAGVLNNYGDMPKGEAKNSKKYFDENPKKFEKLDIKKDDLKNLPAGRIIVYQKDGLPGHIAITNGNGQEMSDHTDNMKWLEAKGEGSTFDVYKLTDNWHYKPQTKKLEFEEK